MPGQAVTLSSEDALLRDDYDEAPRPRKGKRSGKKPRVLRKKKFRNKRSIRNGVSKRSAIADAMGVPQ